MTTTKEIAGKIAAAHNLTKVQGKAIVEAVFAAITEHRLPATRPRSRGSEKCAASARCKSAVYAAGITGNYPCPPTYLGWQQLQSGKLEGDNSMSGKGRGRRSYRDLIGQGKARMVKARLPES